MVDPDQNPFEDAFDLDEIFTPNVKNWPYGGEERVVTLGGVVVEANEFRGDTYDDTGKPVEFEAARALDPNDLPAGYEYAPQLDLVLKMTVDDRSLPEPQYPPRVKLGNSLNMQVNDDGTRFRFVKRDGSARLPGGQSGFADLIRTLAGIIPGFAARFAAVKEDPERWFTTAMFEGLTFVMGPYTSGEGQYRSTKAWPLRAAEGTVAVTTPAAVTVPSAPAVETPATTATDLNALLATIATEATSAEDFRTKVMNGRLGDASLLKNVIADPDGEWQKALALVS